MTASFSYSLIPTDSLLTACQHALQQRDKRIAQLTESLQRERTARAKAEAREATSAVSASELDAELAALQKRAHAARRWHNSSDMIKRLLRRVIVRGREHQQSMNAEEAEQREEAVGGAEECKDREQQHEQDHGHAQEQEQEQS